METELKVDDFGTLGGTNKLVKRYTWKTSKGMIVQVISYGATITSIKVPDKYGNLADVVLGFDDMQGYQNPKNPYFGATVGRYANRIKNATFNLNGKTYNVSKNKGENHLHGGFIGFDKVIWDSYVDGNRAVFKYLSRDGEEGYPGAVMTQIIYEVFETTVKIHMESKSDKPTPINLTNHAYFNLAGHETGASEVYEHTFILNSNKYTPLDEDLTTTGEIKELSHLGIFSDLSKPTALKHFMPSNGLDTNFCINQEKGESVLNFMAKSCHPSSGRTLELYSNKPGVQFYTSNFLPEINIEMNERIFGKNGTQYNKHGAFCLEPQAYPNAVNNDNFPNTIFYPGKDYVHDIVFKFGVE